MCTAVPQASWQSIAGSLLRRATLARARTYPLRALDQVAGSLPDVYEPGYLDRLRDEWR
jgi:hypothetical protein